jgi:BlaI family transcriptional regulator, penicillinase repressor
MASKEELPALSQSQLEIMHVVWELNEATVTDVWQQLLPKRKIARNTILTLMDRLAKRGWLKREPLANSHKYRAAVSRKSALGDVVDHLVKTAFSDSPDRLMMALLDSRGITADEAARIKQMIDASVKKKKSL